MPLGRGSPARAIRRHAPAYLMLVLIAELLALRHNLIDSLVIPTSPVQECPAFLMACLRRKWAPDPCKD